jgi:hypothetical protein
MFEQELKPPHAVAPPAGVMLCHRTAIPWFTLRAAPPRLPPSHACAPVAVRASVRAHLGFSSATTPWLPFTAARGRSPLRPLSLFCLEHCGCLRTTKLVLAPARPGVAGSRGLPASSAAAPPSPPVSPYRPPSAHPSGAPDSPRCGEHSGAHPEAGDLTNDDLSLPVISPPLGWMTCGASGPTISHRLLVWVHCTRCA